MTDLRTIAEDIHEQFKDDLDITVDDVESRLDDLVTEYKVPKDEARRSVISTYLDQAGLERDQLSSGDDDNGNEEKSITQIDRAEEWIDLTAKVVELWEPNSDAVAQVGLLGDETGTIKFTKWSKSDLSELEEGKVYDLRNVVTDEYEGRYSVKLNRTTIIEEREEDIEIGDDSVEVEGALVDIQSGSGLIKRCSEEDCTRVLENGRCSEHGEDDEDGVFDMRIKAVLDDGNAVHEVIFDEETTTEITGISMDEAQKMARDALDREVVADEMRSKLIGQYYRVTGPKYRRYVLVDAVEQLGSPTDVDELLIKARSI